MKIGEMGQVAHTEIEQQRGDRLFLSADSTEVRLEAPLSPPSGWCHLIAMLHHVAGFRKIDAVRNAQAELLDYHGKHVAQREDSRRVLESFRTNLAIDFGRTIADMCVGEFKLNDAKRLTARTVSEVIGKAERLRESMQAQNNGVVALFLENAPVLGEQLSRADDMNAVFSAEAGAPLPPGGAWQDAVGQQAMFITAYVRLRCSSGPVYGKVAISPGTIREAAREALALYREIVDAPGVSEEQRGALLELAAEGKSHDALRDTARRLALGVAVGHLLYPFEPASLLCQVAHTAERNGQAEMPAALRMTLARSLARTACAQASAWAANLPGGPTLPTLPTMLAFVEQQLATRVQAAFEGHYRALGQIDNSAALLPAQKQILRQIATVRRIDPVQVEAYTALARTAGAALREIDIKLRRGNFAGPIAALRRIRSQLNRSIEVMKEAADAAWDPASLAREHLRDALMLQFSALVIASISPEEATALSANLAGKAGHQLVQGLLQSVDPDLVPIYRSLVELLAIKSGESPETAVDRVSQLVCDILPERLFPSALKAAIFHFAGAVDREFHAAMKAHLVAPLPPESVGERTLSDGSHVGEKFWQDMHRVLILTLPDGEPMVDRSGWDEIGEALRQTRLEAGYARLVRALGSEEKARHFTREGYPRLRAAFASACSAEPAHSPLTLPDGTPVSVPALGDEVIELTLQPRTVSIDPPGAPAHPLVDMHFIYYGLHPDKAVDLVNTRDYWLDSQSGKYIVIVPVRLHGDGGLSFERWARYEYCLSLAAWTLAYPEPTIADLRQPGYAAHDDLLAFAKDDAARRDLRALDEVLAYIEAPTTAGARRLIADWFEGENALVMDADGGQRQACEAAARGIVGMFDPALFDPLLERLLERIDKNTLQPFVAAVKEAP